MQKLRPACPQDKVWWCPHLLLSILLHTALPRVMTGCGGGEGSVDLKEIPIVCNNVEMQQ